MRRVFRSALVVPAVAATLWFTAGCGDSKDQLASTHVRSEQLVAGQPLTIEIGEQEFPELAGLKLVIPAGAITEDTKVTIGLGFDAIARSPDVAASPVIILGPRGLPLAKAAQLTLPYKTNQKTATSKVMMQTEDAVGGETRLQGKVDAAAKKLTVDIQQFDAFQVVHGEARTGAEDGGVTDPPLDAGPYDDDGGFYDGGWTDPPVDAGHYDGGWVDPPVDGGSYDGGSYDGGSYDGGSYDGGSYDGGSRPPLDAGSYDAGF